MEQLFRRVSCRDRLPGENGVFITNIGHRRFMPPDEWWASKPSIIWWLEPVKEPQYNKSDMSACWDAALSLAAKLLHHPYSFEEFIKTLNK